MSDELETIIDAPAAPAEPQSLDLMDDFVSSLTADEKPAEAPPAEDKPAEAEETPPAPEDKPAEEETVPEVPKNRKDWDTLRGSRDKWKQTAEEVKTAVQEKDQTIQSLTAELEELRSRAAKVPELEDKLKDFDAYEKELAVTRLEATREYRDTIAKPLQTIGEEAEKLAQANETDAETILDVMREADPVKQRQMFKDATSGWDDVDKGDLWSMVKDARVILDKQETMRNNASAAAKEQLEMATKREQAEKEESRKAFTASAKEVAAQLREKTPFIPVLEGETEEDRYSLLMQKVSEVDFDTQSPRGKAFAAAAALLHPKMVKTVKKLQAELDTLRARVKDTNATRASVSPSSETRPAEESQDFLAAMGIPTNQLSHPLNVIGQ
jgi:hypothetical protein